MLKTKKNTSLEKSIFLLRAKARVKSISIKEILQTLSGRGKLLIVVLLSLPFCQPIMIPGLSTPFGLVIAFMGIRIAFGKRIWLPKKVVSKKISRAVIYKMTKKALGLLKKLDPWIHQRLEWVSSSSVMRLVNGIAIIFLGILLALPLPVPFSNLLAAWALFLLGLGMLRNDGIFILLSYLVFLITIVFFVATFITLKSVF